MLTHTVNLLTLLLLVFSITALPVGMQSEKANHDFKMDMRDLKGDKSKDEPSSTIGHSATEKSLGENAKEIGSMGESLSLILERKAGKENGLNQASFIVRRNFDTIPKLVGSTLFGNTGIQTITNFLDKGLNHDSK